MTRLGTPVADETQLAGGYTFMLRWTPAEGERSGLPGLPPVSPPVGPGRRTVALQEQLGLRLERRRVPNVVLVIDRATLPTSN